MGRWLIKRTGKPGAGRVMLRLMGMMVFGLVSPAQRVYRQPVRFNPDPRIAARSIARGPVHIFREIRDPQTGAHWLILPDAANPARPARMVLAPDVSRSDTSAPAETVALVVAIHLGDRIVVEEHTRMAEAYLEAVALEPAVAGAEFHVRLRIGGRVVRVLAIAAGRAALMPLTAVPPSGVRP